MSEAKHKAHLLAQSEKVVDVQLQLEDARAKDDREKCDELFVELEKIGDDLVGLQSELHGDDLAFSHFMLGSVCALMGLWPHSETAYAKALDQWPDHVGLLNEMAECQFELGQYAKAAEYLERSIKAGGHTPTLAHDLAAAYAWCGETTQARLTLINALARFPADTLLMRALAEIDQEPYNR